GDEMPTPAGALARDGGHQPHVRMTDCSPSSLPLQLHVRDRQHRDDREKPQLAGGEESHRASMGQSDLAVRAIEMAVDATRARRASPINPVVISRCLVVYATSSRMSR